MCAHILVRMCTHVCVSVRVCVHACVYACMPSCICVCACVPLCVYMRARVCVEPVIPQTVTCSLAQHVEETLGDQGTLRDSAFRNGRNLYRINMEQFSVRDVMESHCGQNSNFCIYYKINIGIGILSICMQFLSAVIAWSQFECNYFMHL